MTARVIWERPRVRRLFRRWWPVLFAPAGLVLVGLAQQSPALTERLYAEGIYPLLAGGIGALTSLLPFSVFELGLLAVLVGTAGLLCFAVIRSVSAARGKNRFPRFGLFFEWLFKGLCILYFVFVTTCGLNYYRMEFATFSGLTVRDSSVQELAMLCVELTERANELRAQLPEDAENVMMLSDPFSKTAKNAQASFAKLAKIYPVLPNYRITPKPVIHSKLMSHMQLTGEFTLLTFEANINQNAPDYSIPHTMCHELAHTRGFMREDEANFIGYLACIGSDTAEFQYSGIMSALLYAENRLYSADPLLYERVAGLLSDGARRDFIAGNHYWAAFEGPIATVTDAVNNVYLKANHQQDGVKSYGRMVDLLLAEYRLRHGIA